MNGRVLGHTGILRQGQHRWSCWDSWQLKVTEGLGGTSSLMPHPFNNPRMVSREVGKGFISQRTGMAFPSSKSEPPKSKKGLPGQLLRSSGKDHSRAQRTPLFPSHRWAFLSSCPEHGSPPPDLFLPDCHLPSEHALCRCTCILANPQIAH